MELLGISLVKTKELEQLRSIASGAQHLHLRLQELERLKNEQLEQLRRHLDWVLRTSGAQQIYSTFPEETATPSTSVSSPPSQAQLFQQLQEEFFQEIHDLEQKVNHG